MAVINRNLQLRDINSNLVFPRASLDNIQRSKNDGRDALIVTLNDEGYIDSALLPDSAETVVMLKTVANAAPTGATTGDRYYNISQNKIYTYSGSAWGEATTPDTSKIYLATDTNNIYRYDGTSQMVDVTVHYSVLQSVANDPTYASATGVPSEAAVAVALSKKQDKVSGVVPIVVGGEGAISLQYGAGLSVDDNSLVVPKDYIVHTVDSMMLRDAGPAEQSAAYVNGGTVYTILGDAEITTTIVASNASDNKVPTEAAVRSAINAAIATGGSTVVAGNAINVEGGSINVTTASTQDVLEGLETLAGATVATPIMDRVNTPGNLRGALSVGQAVDVTCDPVFGASYWQYSIDGGATWITSTTFLNNANILNDFMVKYVVSSNGSLYLGFHSQGSAFPKFADGLRYLFIVDIKNVGSAVNSLILNNYPGSPIAVKNAIMVLPSAECGAGRTTYTRLAMVSSVASMYIGINVTAGITVTLAIKNFRQYEVTALTDEAIAYIAQLPDPDAFFRSQDAYSIRNKYLIKQDMVCPFIPMIEMPANSDLTVGAGLAYKLAYTDANTHRITVDTIPTNGYGRDAHIQLFVKDTSSVIFAPPLNLLNPLTPNAGHNLIVKFRAGQANVYVDDTDVGYVVSVASGSTYGSLNYALNNDVGEYVVFSRSLDGVACDTNMTGDFTKTNSAFTIVGNGVDKTILNGFVGLASNVPFTIVNATLTNTNYRGTQASIAKTHQGGLWLQNCNITVTTNTTNALVCWGRSLFLTNANITGCTAYELIDVAHGSVSITGCTITNNTITRSGNYGIMIVDTQEPPSTITITNSYLDASAKMTIRGASAGTIAISGSTLTEGCDILLQDASKLNFSGVNVLNSTVSGAGTVMFADGATVKSTIGTGVLGASGLDGRLINKSVTLENLTITGATTTGSVFYTGEDTVLTLINCVITGNTTSYGSASEQGYMIQNSGGKVILNNVTIGVNAGPSTYAIKVHARYGHTYVNNVSLNRIDGLNGYCIISGDNTTGLYTVSSSSTSTKFVFTPGSIVRTSQSSFTCYANAKVYVGILDESTGTITEEGTATVVLNGTTVSITGSGTTIDANGLHS